VTTSRGPADAPAWEPGESELRDSNLARLLRDRGFASYAELHTWSVRDRAGFWEEMLRRLGIVFRTPPARILDLAGGVEHARWLPGARLAIVESCFRADPGSTAVVHRREGGPLRRTSYGELDRLSARVADGLAAAGCSAGDPIAVDLPMSLEAVAIYLGILKAGGIVVSIADSFAPEEIATRLRIAGARDVFTEDVLVRGGRIRPLYEKVVAAGAPRAIVLPAGERLAMGLRPGDLAWEDFLPPEGGGEVVEGDPDDPINVLFSSGTTGDPKAIPWTKTTPIKCAADGWLHLDVRPGDVVAWPTSLGWMMGPWLIFAALVNRATIALHVGSPTNRGFCEFVRDARVNVLGLVPSLVRSWRTSGSMDDLDWSAVRVIGSTGEASSAADYRWLMERVGAPVVEYCGGTEIGGGYITGTVLQPAVPATFTTPALGLDLVILDEDGRETDEGEVFLVPPSIGLSSTLLNRDHHEVYFEGAPRGPVGQVLRRHGDRLERLPGGGFRAHGRADDTMNLGGIKVSSAEIERVLNATDGVLETAAVAVPPREGGPERLFVFAVARPGAALLADQLRPAFQSAIRERLNPLFRVHEVRVVDALPRTASNKVMRRVLRDRLSEG
jgi:acetyl-CoA synthetase